MGGYGSGRRYGRAKRTVERCLILSSAKLQRDRLLRAGLHAPGSVTWSVAATGEKTDSVGCEVNTLDRADAWIRLHYTRVQDKDEVAFRVRLTTTPLPWGGVRWWFVCPLTVNGRSCGRRCGNLYLPPGGRYFGCRVCYDLTYESTRHRPLPEALRIARWPHDKVRRWARRQLKKIEREGEGA